MTFREYSMRRGAWRLLARYFANECDAEEVDELRARLAVDAEAVRRLEEAERAWAASGRPPAAVDVRADWERLDRRVRETRFPDGAPARVHPLPGRQRHSPASAWTRRPPRQRPCGGLLRIAAVLLVTAGLSLFASWLLPRPPIEEPAQPAKVVATEVGKRASVRMADGTSVTLNAESQLIIAADFNEGPSRRVRLVGEGYFEVASDPDRPFIVETAAGDVRVLGTAFDVRAYPDEEEMQVVVVEGRVGVRAGSGSAAADSVILRPNHLVTVAGRRLLRVRPLADAGRYLAWTEGRLVFVEAPFDDVVRRLERWYDLDIDVETDAGPIGTFNGAFEDEPLSEILNTVAVALGLRYERDHRHITFSRQPVANAPSPVAPANRER